MAMAGDGRAIAGEGERSRKRPFRPEINMEPQNVSQEAWQNNSSGVPDHRVSISVTVGKSELEQILEQMTFTRSEVQRLTALLHSRINDDSVVESDAITTVASPQETTIENLPEDILSKIFIRLLAKQLAQMRCVSKSWNALLTQPSFVKSHLHHSICINDRILLVFYYMASYFDSKPLTAIACQPPHLELTNFIKLPPVDVPHLHDVIGSVHGLICSRYHFPGARPEPCDRDDVIHIWNPSLSAVSTLPPYGPRGDVFSFRFGFDPSTDDYKVVKISCLNRPSRSKSVGKEWMQVEIYSMRKGCWKFLTERIPSHLREITESNGVCVDGLDGHLHWFGHIAEKRGPQTIVAFDLGSETLRELPLPDIVLLDKNNKRFHLLGVLTGKLCMMSCSWSEADGTEVWVMDEYGVAKSWVKRHTFSSGFYSCMSAGFTSNNEFIYNNKDCHLALYDPVADKAKILGKLLKKDSTYKIVEYLDSLVWVSPAVSHQ